MGKEDIQNSIDNIREECDNIEDGLTEDGDDEVEPKKAKTRGDPLVTLY